MERAGELRSVKVMRHILSALVFVVVASSTASAQSYRCDNGSKAASGLKRYIVRLVSAQPSDSELSEDRALYKLPSGPADIVQFESDPAICEAAGAAFHASVSPGSAPHR